MDKRVRVAINNKIKEAIDENTEALTIARAIEVAKIKSTADLAIGILVGRIYNSFHYQTRRILGRNATDQEFKEFVDILKSNADKIKESIRLQ